MDKDLRNLISDIATGDMDALGNLYDILSARVFNYARTITGNRQTAEDITHDVFLQIFKQASRIAKMPNPAAYIMVIARNHSYNLLKRNKYAVASDIAEEVAYQPKTYDRLIFEEAFLSLPTAQRETVYLHLICGFPHKDVAKLQNAPLVTVKWRYKRALSELKTYFTQNEEERYVESI